MRNFEGDYRYLVENVIPLHRLSPLRRREIDGALSSGLDEALRRAAILALEELCDTGFLRRAEVQTVNDWAVVSYVKRRGRYRIRAYLPAEEWRVLRAAPRPVVPDVGGEVVTEVRVEPFEETYEILPEIFRSFSINDHPASTFQRLEGLMGLFRRWLRFSAGRLTLVQERAGDFGGGGTFVRTLPESSVMGTEAYERCVRSRKLELLSWGAARASGLSRPPSPGPELGAEAFAQVAVTPVHAVGESWGVLELWFPSQDTIHAIRNRVEIATGMIEQIIENTIMLEKLTSIDKLTRVFNRQYYDFQIQVEIERATRSGGKLSMLIVDIDDFKEINDSMGHRKGDEALALVADLIKKNLRKIDFAFRYGGEEFVVLLPGTAEMEAVHTAERLRMIIGDYRRFLDGEERPRTITVSIGAAVFPDDARTEEELFAKADAALYRAKQMGKNRVEFYKNGS